MIYYFLGIITGMLVSMVCCPGMKKKVSNFTQTAFDRQATVVDPTDPFDDLNI